MYDKDTFSADDLLGTCVVGLDTAFRHQGPLDTWCPLNDKKNRPAGELRVILTFQSSAPAQPPGGAHLASFAKYGGPSWGGAAAAPHGMHAGAHPATPAYGGGGTQPPAPPPAGLPPGWQMFRDAQGKPYYVNSATGS